MTGPPHRLQAAPRPAAGRRAPLTARLKDWLRAAPLPLGGDPRRVPPDGPPGPVDVVIPVYGAAAELERCLRSLAAHTDLTRHRLVLVLDGPQPAAVGELLARREDWAGAAARREAAPGAAAQLAAPPAARQQAAEPGSEPRAAEPVRAEPRAPGAQEAGPRVPEATDLAARAPEPSAAGDAGVLVLHQAERQGFVAAVNRGMAVSGRDVVLLNSDTRVTAGWLDKLQRAAWSAPEIATVTPFSNSATICSLPRFLESNALPAGWSLDAFAHLVEERSLAAHPRLPTGVGVCLYVKRKALAALGPFDQRSFGLGYGEESEFCMRALKAGYAHVLDDTTFIYHEGHRSFGRSRRARVAAAHRRLARLHPEYLATIARFVREDPLAPLRARVLAALAPPAGGRPAEPNERTAAPGDGAAPPDGRQQIPEDRPPPVGGRQGPPGGLSGQLPEGTPARHHRSGFPAGPRRVLHLVHGWPPWNHAGTELYAAWLVRRQAAHREVTVLSRIADAARGTGDALELLDAGARVRLLVRNFDERDPRARNALASRPVERELRRLLDEVRPELVHIHHLAGHAASLAPLVRRRGIPLLYQIQDWWTPCARANLLDRERRLCSGPAPGKCAACLPLTGRPPAAVLNPLLHRHRAAVTARALRSADAFVMGSRFLHDSYLHLGLLRPGDPVHVLTYGVELTRPAPRRPRQPGEPLRCGVIGSILPHKGIHVAVAAFAGVDPSRATLTVWGDPTADPGYTAELLALGAVLGDPAAAVGVAPVAAAGPPGGEVPRGADAVQASAGTAAALAAALGQGPAGRELGGATLAGSFDDSRKAEIFAALDVLIVPSLGLESFGLVAREAMHHGVPVLASRRGALAELFPEGDGSAADAAGGEGAGALFPPGDAAALRREVEHLIAEPDRLGGWQRRLPAVKGADEHAGEIEEIYRRLLAGKGPP